jgi:phospholipid/cholesterol/gamma-HCH transport system permease protein
LITVPILISFANIVGIAGGILIGSTELNLDPHFYLEKVLMTLKLKDYITGLGKSFFFAFFISVPSCYYGLNVSGGTRGVGLTTTKAVVTSSILIFVGDFFITKLFWIIEKWI